MGTVGRHDSNLVYGNNKETATLSAANVQWCCTKTWLKINGCWLGATPKPNNIPDCTRSPLEQYCQTLCCSTGKETATKSVATVGGGVLKSDKLNGWISVPNRTAFQTTLGLPLRVPPRWPIGKASASRAEVPGFESRLRRDFFGVESHQWLKNWHSSGYPARRLAW